MGHLLDRIIGKFFEPEVDNNLMYGHSALLRRYCRVTSPMPIDGLLQHGWSIGMPLPLCHPELGWMNRSTRLFLWHDRNVQACRELGYLETYTVGSPLLYLESPKNENKPEPRSLLLFPAHSVDSEPYQEDGQTLFSRYLDEIEPMYREFSPVTVCLYYMEYDDPRIRRILNDRGLKTTTIGHRDHTPDFVSRLRDLILQHTYVSTNSFSTSLFYALFLRRRAFVHGQTFANRLWPGKVDLLTTHEKMKQLYPQLEWERFGDTTHEEIGAEEIGADNMRSPAEMRETFGWSHQRQMRMIAGRIRFALRRRLPWR
jgi:hypothetical protein